MIFDQETTPEGIFLVDALHKDVQPLADRLMRAANMPVDRRIYASMRPQHNYCACQCGVLKGLKCPFTLCELRFFAFFTLSGIARNVMQRSQYIGSDSLKKSMDDFFRDN